MRLACRHEPELDVAIRPALLLAVEDVAGVEVPDLAGDLRVRPATGRTLDRADAGAAGEEARPRGRDIVAERVTAPIPVTTTRRPLRSRHRTSFPVRTVAAR